MFGFCLSWENSLEISRRGGCHLISGSQVRALGAPTKRKSLQRSYNEQRRLRRSAISPPAAYAANLTATCDRLRNPEQLRRSHVTPPAPDGVEPAETLIAAG